MTDITSKTLDMGVIEVRQLGQQLNRDRKGTSPFYLRQEKQMSKVKLYWSDGTTNTTTHEGVVDLLLDQTLINIDEGTKVSLIKTEEVK